MVHIDPKHNANLKVGDKVVCNKTIVFCDNSIHIEGAIYIVEPDTQAYYSLFTGNLPHCVYLLMP